MNCTCKKYLSYCTSIDNGLKPGDNCDLEEEE